MSKCSWMCSRGLQNDSQWWSVELQRTNLMIPRSTATRGHPTMKCSQWHLTKSLNLTVWCCSYSSMATTKTFGRDGEKSNGCYPTDNNHWFSLEIGELWSSFRVDYTRAAPEYGSVEIDCVAQRFWPPKSTVWELSRWDGPAMWFLSDANTDLMDKEQN